MAQSGIGSVVNPVHSVQPLHDSGAFSVSLPEFMDPAGTADHQDGCDPSFQGVCGHQATFPD
jgi:hypothetical protein